MEIIIYLILAVILIFLNGFFVLAEFSAVKIRPTQMDALKAKGDKRAETMRHIQTHLDEYLSVCQVGITLASVGLGYVGEPAFAKIIEPLMKLAFNSVISEGVLFSTSITLSFMLVSFLHIVFGELIPKTISIRSTEKSALAIAYPLVFFRQLFIVPIWILNHTVALTLKIFGFKEVSAHDTHNEDEIRLILEQSQSGGLMSFRGLLLMENILDMETLKVKNAIQVKSKVKYIDVTSTKEELEKIVKKYKYSRYPVMENEKPIGYIHVKDLYFAESFENKEFNLKSFIKKFLTVNEDEPLKQLLTVMQRTANHMALVFNDNNDWKGIVTLEDALEEVVGTIEEEYPLESPVYLSEYLTVDRIFFNVEGSSIFEVIRNFISEINDLPISHEEITDKIFEREKLGETYVGHGLCIPHARIRGINESIVAFVRLRTPLQAPTKKPEDKIQYLFLLITPLDTPKIHQKLLARIAGIFESDYLENKLDDDISEQDLYTIIATAELTSIA